MLRFVSNFCTVLAWIVAVTGGLLIQILTLLAFSGENWTQEGRPLLFVCVAVSTVCLWVGLILYTVWKKRPYAGLITVTVSGVLFLVTALLIRHYIMPGGIVTLRPSDGEIALDSLKLLWRHYSPILTPILLWIAALCRQKYCDRREMKEILSEIHSGSSADMQTLDVEREPRK